MIRELNWAAALAFVAMLVLVLTRITVTEREAAGRTVLRLDLATGVVVVVLVATLALRVLAEL